MGREDGLWDIWQMKLSAFTMLFSKTFDFPIWTSASSTVWLDVNFNEPTIRSRTRTGVDRL
jgi:hypothetical protein